VAVSRLIGRDYRQEHACCSIKLGLKARALAGVQHACGVSA
jgi:hypothetical protein